ncbi:DUF4399 domain-containing protein [Dasania sp. GY-MA-18]|uniref:DUF4399 domain-containing protein n=1 Tax=Dasania phycosphaerae TaxID=2950436 RepID=A0A9J6RNW1_9GAMM|nr:MULTISPECIES: DUF4399 domain-containing protein [Dasania]MCR8923261.1 DUF4399 domain-containing protein [Dasania sp. GY-MA-18]MCZ0865693.1 DUF4399 domain-containing protein [Dasania phycosphaerae]MCZ0869418.1 DUF4399 domain-containing protein [Dasania phycosphaerae]
MLKKILSTMLFVAAASQATAQTASPAGAKVYIISPADGAVVTSPVTVTFGLKGMGVAPAGTDRANTGHHHLLVDAKALPAAGQPMGGEVIHFGGGQTETTLELAPGKHSLQLIMGDMAHVPHNPIVASEKITITVK